MTVLKIKSEHEPSQGKFVLINSEDFNPDKHELYVEDQPKIEASLEESNLNPGTAQPPKKRGLK